MAPRNRSAPPHAVVPIVIYDDVEQAVEWLTRTFGFVEKVRIGDHRAQMDAGGGAVIVADATHGRRVPEVEEGVTHSTMVRVHDIDAHHETAMAGGAQIAVELADLPSVSVNTACVIWPATCGPSVSQSPTWSRRIGAG